MLVHPFDIFYIVTKFILPTLDNLKISPIKYEKECKYLHSLDDQDNEQIRQNCKRFTFVLIKIKAINGIL